MGYNTIAQRVRQQRAPVNFYDNNSLIGAEGDQYNAAQGNADAAGSDYLSSASSFDASQALDTYARGAYGKISTALGQQLKTLGGQAVGAGRFDSGFYDADQGQIIRNTMDDFTNNLSTQALGAASLQQQNTAGLGAYAANQQSNATDLLLSRREELVNAAREKAAAKRAKKRGIAGAIGGVLGAAGGAILGGPAGAQAGFAAGSSIGGMF